VHWNQSTTASLKAKVKKIAATVPLLTEAALKVETDIFQAIIETTTTTTTTVTKVLHGQQFPAAPPVLSKLNLTLVYQYKAGGSTGDNLSVGGLYQGPQSLEPLQRPLRWPQRELGGPWHRRSLKGLKGGLGEPLTELGGPKRELGGPQLELEWPQRELGGPQS